MDDIVKRIVEYIDKKLALVTALVSAISIIVTGLFKAGTYLYYKGHYDFWKIPADYIVVNYNNILFKFLLSMSLVIIVLGISGVYIYYFTKIAEKNKGLNKLFKLLCMILMIPIFSTCIFLWYLIIEFSIDEILAYLHDMTLDFFCNYNCNFSNIVFINIISRSMGIYFI